MALLADGINAKMAYNVDVGCVCVCVCKSYVGVFICVVLKVLIEWLIRRCTLYMVISLSESSYSVTKCKTFSKPINGITVIH